MRRTMWGTTIPTNPIGPPRETAAPVAKDALRNAMRCVFVTSTPRVAALSVPTLKRLSDLGSHANAQVATINNGRLHKIGEYPLTFRFPMRYRTAWKVWFGSARYCTNMIIAEKREFSVTPAKSNTVVDSPRRRYRDRP